MSEIKTIDEVPDNVMQPIFVSAWRVPGCKGLIKTTAYPDSYMRNLLENIGLIWVDYKEKTEE